VLDLLMPSKTLSLVNVNLPQKPKGIRWIRQSVRHYDGKVVPDKDPMGRSIFWFTVTPCKALPKGPTAGHSSTIGYRLRHCVSISPMKQIWLEPCHSRIRQRGRSRKNDRYQPSRKKNQEALNDHPEPFQILLRLGGKLTQPLKSAFFCRAWCSWGTNQGRCSDSHAGIAFVADGGKSIQQLRIT
jgi:hypothetical protein